MQRMQKIEGAVSSLEQLKSIKMKELVLKKKFEQAEILRKTDMGTETVGEYSIASIESDFLDLLEKTDLQIAKAKEEAFIRKEILEKVEKWFTARDEESWLEEYNRDDNRYNAGRSSHLSLKRAEKSRFLVNKIPAMVEALTCEVTAWEEETGTEFLYDGDQRRLQIQRIAEQGSGLRIET